MAVASGNWISIEQVADHCFRAGFRGEALEIAIAVIKAESGGGAPRGKWSNTVASGDIAIQDATWGPSIGMFQIRSLKAELGRGTTRDQNANYDPLTNAKHAIEIVGGNLVTTGSFGRRNGGNKGWGHWSVWQQKLHEFWLPQARDAARAREAGGGAAGTGLGAGIGGALNTVGEAVANFPRTASGLAPGGQIIGGPPAVLNGGFDGGFARFPDLNPYGVLADVKLSGFTIKAQVSQAVIDAPTIDLTSSEVSQFTMTVEDKDYNLLREGAFLVNGSVTYADLKFEIAAVETGGDQGPPTVTVEARSAGIQQLKRQVGGLIITDVSPSNFIRFVAGGVGLRFIGEDSAVRPHITRQADDAATAADEAENTWDVCKRLASEVGFVVFETAGTVLFGRPTWLMTRLGVPSHIVRWPAAKSRTDGRSELTPVSLPRCRRSENATSPVTVEVTLDRRDALGIRPGDRLRLRGIPYFDTDYLVTSVPITLDGHSPITVSAATPVDPEPSPPDPGPPAGELGLGFDEGTVDPALSRVGTGDGGAAAGGAQTADPDANVNFGWTWPTRGRVSSEFGVTRSSGRKHGGIDIAAPAHTRIHAARGGVITRRAYSDTYGNVIYMDHGGGLETRYAHMIQFATYKVGDRVEKGQLIGYVGSTGNSTGNHLHFEIRRSDQGENPRDFISGDPLNTLPDVRAT